MSGPSLMFFALTLLSPRHHGPGTIDLKSHFLVIRRAFLSVFIGMIMAFALDGPLCGTEPSFNALRLTQISITILAVWGLISGSDRAHRVISLAVLASVTAVTVIRFFPGQARLLKDWPIKSASPAQAARTPEQCGRELFSRPLQATSSPVKIPPEQYCRT